MSNLLFDGIPGGQNDLLVEDIQDEWHVGLMFNFGVNDGLQFGVGSVDNNAYLLLRHVMGAGPLRMQIVVCDVFYALFSVCIFAPLDYRDGNGLQVDLRTVLALDEESNIAFGKVMLVENLRDKRDDSHRPKSIIPSL